MASPSKGAPSAWPLAAWRWTARLSLAGAIALGAMAATLPWWQVSSGAATAIGDVLQLVASGAASVACLAAARSLAGRFRRGWLLLGAGMAAWCAGQVVWTWYELGANVDVPIPSWSDVGFLAMVPLALAGLLHLSPLSRKSWRFSTGIVLDGVLSALAVFVVAWPAGLDPLFDAQDDRAAAWIAVAYPLLDIVILTLAGGILMHSRAAWRSPLALLYAGLFAIAVADAELAFGFFTDTYATGQLADAGWVVGFMLIATAALAPGRRAVAELTTYGRMIGYIMPLAAALVGVVGAFLEHGRGGHADAAWEFAVGALILLSLARQGLAALDFRIVTRQREAAQADYRALFANMAEGFAHCRMVQDGPGLDFEYLRVNQHFEHMTGLKDVVGQRISRLVPGVQETNPEVLAAYARVAAGGPPERMEVEVKPLGRWFDITAFAAGPGEFVAVFDNVTKRKVVEERLRFQARLLDSVGQAVLATDAAGNITYWGPGAEALYGWTATEVLGHPVLEVTPAHTSQAEATDILARLAMGQPWSGEIVVRRKDGSSITALVRDDPMLGDDGRLAGIIGVSQDISEMKRLGEAIRLSEARLRETQRMAHIGSWELDIVKDELWWSDENYRIFGVEPGAVAPTYGSFLQTIHPDDRDGVDAAYRDSVALQVPYRIEHRLLLPDGKVKWVFERCETFYAPDGKPLRSVGSTQDITERKQAEEARHAMEAKEREVQRLEELNRMRMDFLNTAAHDLKTPLTPLKLQMGALRARGNLDARQKESLDLMDRNVNRFQVLVEDMLDAARLQAGKLRLRRQPVALAPMVQEAVASFEEAARLGGLQMETRLADVQVDADPTKLMQVLMNLVSNAVKYTPKGGRIQVRVHEEAGEARVSVQDDGLGMDHEQIGRLFQPFVRLHEGIAGTAKGTGLGLFISKGITEAHGGRIWCESQGAGHGSTFALAWPLASTATTAVGSPAA